MKNKIIAVLHKLIGFDNYLFIFAIFIFYKLRWDKNEKDFLKIFDLINGDGIVLDIGANIGVMTTHFAKRLKKSQIISFEPIPSNKKILERIIRFFKLKNVRVVEIALSDHEGETEMIMPVINNALKHGLCHIKGEDDTDLAGEEFSVTMNKLDNLNEIVGTDQKITAIKIDVEGHELAVLKGANDTLKKHKPIIYCELWEGNQRDETVKYLVSLGYNMKAVWKNKLLNFDELPTSKQNFFFVPE